MKERNIYTQSIILLLYLILYVFATPIIGEDGNTFILTLAKGLLLIVFFILSLSTAKKTSNIRPIKSLLIGFVIFIFCQIIFLGNVGVLKILGINIFAFIIMANWSSEKLLDVWMWGIKISAIIASLAVSALAIIYGGFVYLRGEAFIDKSFITALDSISFIVILSELFYGRNKKINILVLVFLFIVDLLIIQSKISLFVFGVIFVLGTIKLKKLKISNLLLYILIGACTFFLISIILPRDSIALDPIKQGINMLFGKEIMETQRAVLKTETYDIRGDVWNYCLGKLFVEHPIIGVGLGRFPDYAIHGPASIQHLTQTESSLLSVITEGGLFYFFLMLNFFGKFIKRSVSTLKRYSNYYSFLSYSLFIGYAIMIIGNDFFDSLFWIQAGLIYGVIYKKMLYNNKVRK